MFADMTVITLNKNRSLNHSTRWGQNKYISIGLRFDKKGTSVTISFI